MLNFIYWKNKGFPRNPPKFSATFPPLSAISSAQISDFPPENVPKSHFSFRGLRCAAQCALAPSPWGPKLPSSTFFREKWPGKHWPLRIRLLHWPKHRLGKRRKGGRRKGEKRKERKEGGERREREKKGKGRKEKGKERKKGKEEKEKKRKRKREKKGEGRKRKKEKERKREKKKRKKEKKKKERKNTCQVLKLACLVAKRPAEGVRAERGEGKVRST